MKVNELRIGNWVTDNKGRIASVHLITMINGVYTLHLLDPLSSNHFHKRLNDIKSIPLTEEILLKSDFKNTESNPRIFTKGVFMIWFHDDTKTWDFIIIDYEDEWVRIKDLDGLHTLQNLYFALTGEELEINL